MDKIARYGVASRQLSPRERWVCFAALFFLGFTATFNQFKVAPAIQFIGTDLGIATDMLSQIMGVFSIAGMLLAFPGMWVMQRCGVKSSIMVTAVIQLIGSLVCVFATSAAVFLIGRTLEGVAYGLICVIGPNIMPRLFPLRTRALAWAYGRNGPLWGSSSHSLPPHFIFDAAGGAAVPFAWASHLYVS